MSGLFRYSALHDEREIRLIQIKPGGWDDDVEICIAHAHLDQDPFYEALSYTWGNPNQVATIIADGEGGQLFVTHNCYIALRKLRTADQQRTLWVDAICIDQSNIAERNHQVGMMSDIYHLADRVIAFLGDDSEGSILGMQFILEDAASLLHAQDRPSVGLDSARGAISSPQQKALDQILRRPYFERVWILQEIQCARQVDIRVGDITIDWQSFSRTVFYADVNKKIHQGGRYRGQIPTVVFYKDQSRIEKPNTLLQFLNDTRHCKATDARDKIYALFAISDTKQHQILKPDYSIETRTLYISVAKWMIAQYDDLDVLSHCLAHSSLSSVSGLPSWVPDWSVPRFSTVLGYPRSALSKPYFKASLDSRPQVSFSNSRPDILNTRGKVVATVSQIAAPYWLSEGKSLGILREWKELALSNLTSTVQSMSEIGPVPSATITNTSNHGRGPEEIFLETLIASPVYKNLNRHVTLHGPAWLASILSPNNNQDRKTLGNTTPINSVAEERAKAEAAIFRSLMRKASHGRRFCVASSTETITLPVEASLESLPDISQHVEPKLIGLVPPETALGDLIVILPGSQVPFVLRMQSDAEKAPGGSNDDIDKGMNFQLIGECYMYGLMGGEAMQRIYDHSTDYRAQAAGAARDNTSKDKHAGVQDADEILGEWVWMNII